MKVRETPRNRLSRPDDPRAVKSRQALREGLLGLLQTRDLDQISIRDITGAAGVSYPVFFRQFAGKDDLLADLAAREVQELLALARPAVEAEPLRGGLMDMCCHVERRRSLWKTLLTAGAAAEMRKEFARISAEIGNTGPRANPWLPVELASSFVASGIFEILAWWLGQPEDYPIGNVVKILHALVARPLAEPQDVTLD